MKRRILNVLVALGKGENHPMKAELQRDLDMGDDMIRLRSKAVLRSILHEYSRFAVVTIDSFFHFVIRSFAREIGLQGSFSITLEDDKVIQEVVDNLIVSISDPEQIKLKEWLTQFAESNVEEGKPWDFRRDVVSLSKEILKDKFKESGQGVLDNTRDSDFYESFRKDLDSIVHDYEDRCEKIGNKGLELLNAHGGVEVFNRKANGPAGLFQMFADGKFEVSTSRKEAIDNLEKWLTKKTLGDPKLIELLENEIFPTYKGLINFFESNKVRYKSAKEIRRYHFTLGILSEVNRKLNDFRDDQDLMLIADLPDFLRQIINDSETPYVYEKVGSIYKNFLIDEFQDTSTFQWENFKSLVKNSTDSGDSCIVVGDLKQSIYRWRGGDWNILQNQLKDDFDDYLLEEIDLKSNWRSSNQIIEFNNSFFEDLSSLTAEMFIDLEDASQNYLEGVLNIYKGAHQEKVLEEEGGFVSIEFLDNQSGKWKEMAIEKVIHLVEDAQKRGYRPRDIAILTRTKGEGKEISNAFFRYKSSDQAIEDMSYEVVSSEALYLHSSHAVKFIISLLKWLDNENNNIALSEWVYELCRFIEKSPETSDSKIFQSREEWKRLVPRDFIKERDRLKTLPIYELISDLIRYFDLSRSREEYTYLQAFQDAVLDFAKNERGDIGAFLQWWESIRKERSIQIADDNDAIKILTIHKAKGLEFPIVIIPFLNWKLDHDTYSQEEILWCGPPNVEPFNQLPALPLKYTSSLKDTYWSTEYYREKINAFIDNVNLLYVSFTRSIDNLFVFGPYPKSDKISSVADLTMQRVKTLGGWDEKNIKYTSGHLDSKSFDTLSHDEYGLVSYPCSSWRSKVALQMHSNQDLIEDVFSAQKWGISFHKKLSRLKRLEDLPYFANDDLKRQLQMIVHHEDIEPFFKDVEEVRIEEPILLPGGQYKRVDRLIRKDGEWKVVDFKTGQRRKKDREQVQEYVDILNEMGYGHVTGYLIYLEPVLVEQVSY